MASRIVFPARQQVSVESFEPEPLADTDVRVTTTTSLMSTGTENIAFNGIFEPGSHWERYVQYPFQPGYASVGTVVERGASVQSVDLGEQVYFLRPHASEHVLDAASVFPVGEGIDPADAVWCSLAAVAFVAARRARIELGDTVLVIGAGPVGQMAVRWAKAAGASRVIAMDPAGERLELARRGGATSTIPLAVSEAEAAVRAANGGELVDIVIEATGRAASFAESLPLVADFGRLILVGDTGTPTHQHLTADLLPRGLTVIGAHLAHIPYVLGIVPPRQSVSPGQRADALSDDGNRHFAQIFFDLVRAGTFDLGGLVTHRFNALAPEDAYSLANARREDTMGIVFEWAG